MAEAVTIARPYAEAVFALADKGGDLGRWSRTLATLAAVAENPDRQQMQITTVDLGDSTVSALVVGQQVALPVVGEYGLYFIYPMQRERDIINLVGRTFVLGGIALILLVGAIAFVVTRLVADPVRRAAIVAERFAGGNLNERMRAKGEDDLARAPVALTSRAGLKPAVRPDR